MSFETQAWLECFKRMEKDVPFYQDTLHGSRMAQFDIPVDNGLVSNLLFNTGYPVFSYFLYAFTAFIAPFLFLVAVVMSIVFRRKAEWVRVWRNIMLLSFGICAYIFLLAVCAASIDRYGFPVTGFCALLMCVALTEGIRFIWVHKTEAWMFIRGKAQNAAK